MVKDNLVLGAVLLVWVDVEVVNTAFATAVVTTKDNVVMAGDHCN